MERDVSGYEIFRFLTDRGFRICESYSSDLDILVMARDCDDVPGAGYVSINTRQTSIPEGYLRYTLQRAGFSWEYFWGVVGTTS